MSSTVEQIKERLSIVEVVTSYVRIEKAGKNFKAKCPFHNERTPSFFVSPERGSYYCFGCNHGGDMFNFIEGIEGVDFLGALKILASRAGVPLEKFNRRVQSEKERLYDLMDEAANFFENELSRAEKVCLYLKERGITEKTIKSFRVGYAPTGWRAARSNFLKKGWSDKELLAAGLIVAGGASPYDRFRGRIMFPIADSSGRVIAFSGRVFGAETRETGMGKYVNSPETVLYKKSKTLFGFDKARMFMRQKDACILVEGQIDLLLSVGGGAPHTVATSGTALSDEHLSLIRRMTENLIFAFDADDAGFSASGRGIDKALSHGFTIRVVKLPRGSDPADIVKQDPTLWLESVGNAVHIIDFLIATLRENIQDEHVLQKDISRKVLPYVLSIPNPIEQAHFVKKIAQTLSLDEDPIWQALKQMKGEQAARKVEDYREGTVADSRVSRKSQRTIIEERILGIVLWQKREEKPLIDIDSALNHFESITSVRFQTITDKLSREDMERVTLEAVLYHDGGTQLTMHLDELFLNLREALLKERFQKAMDELRVSERSGDERETASVLEKCREISHQLNMLSLEKRRAREI